MGHLLTAAQHFRPQLWPFELLELPRRDKLSIKLLQAYVQRGGCVATAAREFIAVIHSTHQTQLLVGLALP